MKWLGAVDRFVIFGFATLLDGLALCSDNPPSTLFLAAPLDIIDSVGWVCIAAAFLVRIWELDGQRVIRPTMSCNL